MEPGANFIEPLLQRVEDYSKTSFELLKLKSVDKAATFFSSLLCRFMMGFILFFVAILINVAIALWLGDFFGKNFYGFLVLALFYGLVAIIMYLFLPSIKARIINFLIAHMLK